MIDHAKGVARETNFPIQTGRRTCKSNPIFFDGRGEEALDFYHKALDAEVTMLKRFKENPDPTGEDCTPASGSEDKIMHCEFRIGKTTVLASEWNTTPWQARVM